MSEMNYLHAIYSQFNYVVNILNTMKMSIKRILDN